MSADHETVRQRNMRMGWGCKCHGDTFCPDLMFVGFENDVPIYVRADRDAEKSKKSRTNAHMP